VSGFSPLDLNLDGKYHNMNVTLKNPQQPGLQGADLQVRKGYYAPKYAADPAEYPKQQEEEAYRQPRPIDAGKHAAKRKHRCSYPGIYGLP